MFFNVYPSEKIAIKDAHGNVLSYLEVNNEVARFGENIMERSLCFCLCDNNIGSVLGYIGLLNNRVVPLLLNRKIAEEQLFFLIDCYRPRYIYLPQRMTEVNGYTKELYAGWDYVLLENSDNSGTAIYDELALLLPTSGSTGSPKFVRISYRNLQANTKSIETYLEIDETEKAITTLPMYYTYGLSVINTHIDVGATVLLTEDTVMMKSFWEFANNGGATSFAGVPYTYEMLKHIGFFNMNLPNLRYMTQAGGKLLPQLHKEFAVWSREHNKKFIAMYGQTEATARMSWLPAKDSVEKYGSIGIAIPGGKLSLVDENGIEIYGSKTVGELKFEGENVTLGYAEGIEDLGRGDERHGVLMTGDMAERDEDGYYYIVGRKKRILKIFGNRINLDEVERILKEKYTGMDIAVSGIDDEMHIYIAGDTLDREVKSYISRKTHLSEMGFLIKHVDEIPKNDSGKISYGKLL